MKFRKKKLVSLIFSEIKERDVSMQEDQDVTKKNFWKCKIYSRNGNSVYWLET